MSLIDWSKGRKVSGFCRREFRDHQEAEKWLEKHGFSYGPGCRSKLRGIMKGEEWIIAKWHNLTKKERKECHGVLHGWRDDPAFVLIDKKYMGNQMNECERCGKKYLIESDNGIAVGLFKRCLICSGEEFTMSQIDQIKEKYESLNGVFDDQDEVLEQNEVK